MGRYRSLSEFRLDRIRSEAARRESRHFAFTSDLPVHLFIHKVAIRSCSVVLERGMRCGFVLCAPPKACRLEDGDEDGSGSMSRSKIADEEECL